MGDNQKAFGNLGRRSFLRYSALTSAAAAVGTLGVGQALAAPAPARDASGVPISLIGLPYLMGTRALNTMYGMAQGPVTLLKPEHAPKSLRSYFKDVRVQMIENVDEPPPPLPRGDQMARIFAQNIALAAAVRGARKEGRLPVVSIGTCSAGLGMVAGLADEGDIGLLWFDAHSDAQTPENTVSGFIEGMVVPMISGEAWQRYSLALEGFRPIPPERIISAGLAAHPWPLDPNSSSKPVGTAVHKHELDRIGVEAALGPALDQLARKCRKVFVHMDADTIDPSVYRNFLGRPDITGLSIAQMERAFDMIGERFEIVAVDFSAYDPVPDPRSAPVLSNLMLHAAQAAARSRKA